MARAMPWRLMTIAGLLLGLAGCVVYEPPPVAYPAYPGGYYAAPAYPVYPAYPPVYGSVNVGFGFGGGGWHHHWR